MTRIALKTVTLQTEVVDQDQTALAGGVIFVCYVCKYISTWVQLEKVQNEQILSGTFCNMQADLNNFDFQRDIPDGHRAPVPEISRTSGTRSIDTQTPSGNLDDRSSGSSASPNRPLSISPAIIGHMDHSPRPSSSYDSSGSTPRDKEIGKGRKFFKLKFRTYSVHCLNIETINSLSTSCFLHVNHGHAAKSTDL